ncbi:hypothetical protein M406DRAFT_287879 [Cryphonectria parasitica EP155]|uniref:Uncharacterized protein n=1 Tax=Cryphonectria parasitica (strain ATCC 38755 / EP155) TaxID=660469 RepID=A0A9P4Y574_CRYP1|nr:uncharacterized protein M406DRAFT_287879 [Cryphonectria parasitica EP155]KAF3766918.1 hypothetical protein M406DRAFT_287879 [Cryphonectria parasitica EP155]
MVRTTRKAGTPKPNKPTFNPARAVQDRDWRRKQKAQLNASSASRASSQAGSPPPPSATGPGTAAIGLQSRCINPKCTSPDVGEDGICKSCGYEATDQINIVSEVQFGEAANGQAYAQGVNIGFGEAGHRMTMQNGRRRVAGGGDGPNNIETLRTGQNAINGIVLKCQLPSRIADVAMAQFKHMQARGFLRGRTTDRGAGAAVYWAVRNSGNTRTMLIDIADVINIDVFRLGRTFKKLLAMLYSDPAKDCPFEPLFPEDIIKSMCSRLGFDLETEKVQKDAVRIVSRMDRDWINTGRKPAGVCGSAVMVAARMNNFRRTAEEVSYVAKTTTATLRQRLDEFARVDSAKMSIAHFREKDLIGETHDPPAFYRQTKEYRDEIQKKREATPSQQPPQTQTDSDGFAIPALPPGPRSPSRSISPQVPAITEDDLGEANPEDDQDMEDALASKYGDGRLNGSAMRGFDFGENWQDEELEKAQKIEQDIMNADSDMWKAAEKWSGKTKEQLLDISASMRPARYQGEGSIDAPDVADDEFANDPEVLNCLLTEEESQMKEQLWLNENKDWLRQQQEKEYKAKTTPPKKPRKNHRKPRIGEGQSTPASSAGDAAIATIKRHQVSKKFDYDALKRMLSGRGGPGSVIGSEMASRQTSRAGSETASVDDDEDMHDTQGVEEDEDDVEEDDEGQYNNNEGDDDEFGGDDDDEY